MLTPRFFFGIGTNGLDAIYIFGGVWAGHEDFIDKYDTTLDTWTNLTAKLPQPGVTEAEDGKDGIIWVFVLSGRTLHTFDTDTETLTQVNIPGIPSCKLIGAIFCETIIILFLNGV